MTTAFRTGTCNGHELLGIDEVTVDVRVDPEKHFKMDRLLSPWELAGRDFASLGKEWDAACISLLLRSFLLGNVRRL